MIPKKPKPSKETKAQRFIRAGSTPPAAASSNGSARQIKPVLIGFEQALLARIDGAAASMGLSRTAFVVMSCAERVGRVERGE